MKIDAIKTNTSYFIPANTSKLSSFRGDSKTTTTTTLPAQGQDVVQISSKPSDNENSGSGSRIHNIYNGLKHFFMDEPSFDPGFDDLDMIIYRSLTY